MTEPGASLFQAIRSLYPKSPRLVLEPPLPPNLTDRKGTRQFDVQNLLGIIINSAAPLAARGES
jgi:hypothetical protein